MKGNARIKSTMLGVKDHGMLSSFIFLEQVGSCQGFGGYRLDSPGGMPHWAAAFWISRVLDTVGVDKWEALEGQLVRVEGEEFGEIRAIGNIVEDKWFYVKSEWANMDAKMKAQSPKK